jgi:hypothetical protein
MYHIDDPEEMTPEERFKEVAAILAKGLLRMKKRTAGITGPSLEAPNEPDSKVKSSSKNWPS